MRPEKRIQQPNFRKFNFETIEEVNCSQIREKLDELFSGKYLLEHMDAGIKRFLLGHLASCSDCCRSFDVRMHFRPVRHNAIY